MENFDYVIVEGGLAGSHASQAIKEKMIKMEAYC
jgi:succinate dehydrogenase/fumarate reductase flavoprotein subunit